MTLLLLLNQQTGASPATSAARPASPAPREPPEFPPAWADAWGDDRFGLWAEFELQGVTQRLRWIEPGEFLMGSPDTERHRESDEGPQHRVRIGHGFWIANTTCTQALWQVVMGDNPSQFTDDPCNPVERVGWDEAQIFLQRLGLALQGLAEPQLPSEAEWEYACRAGTTGTFNQPFPHAFGAMGRYRERTMPADMPPANAWGLHGMHGNVWEWCRDGRRTYAALAQDEVLLDPQGHQELTVPRAVRAGSLSLDAEYLRSALRNPHRRGDSLDHQGFRFAMQSGGMPGRG